MIQRFAPLLLLTVAAAQSLTFQPLPARGMMTAQSAGIVFGNDLETVVLKGPGLPAALSPLTPSVTAGAPDYSTDAIVAFILSNWGKSLDALEIDAMSTGNDLLPLVYLPAQAQSPHTFRIAVSTAQAWATLSLVREIPGQNVGADILGYYFENPSFPLQLRNTIAHEAVRADYQPAGFDPAGSDIEALDYAMGQIIASRGAQEAGVIENVQTLYFSVTPSCATKLHGFGIFAQPIDGATIFRVNYHPNGTISTLAVETRPNLPFGSDVDALGVAIVHGPVASSIPNAVSIESNTTMFLLSFAPQTPGCEELMVLAKPMGVASPLLAPLRTPGDEPLIGTVARPGTVTAVCCRDPDWNTGARSFGVPFADPYGSVPVFSLEVGNPDSQQPTDRFEVIGVVAGAALPGWSVWLAVVESGQTKLSSLGPWPANQGQFSFRTKLDYGWRDANGLIVAPGIGLGCTNHYELTVVCIPPPTWNSDVSFVVSTTCRLRRQDYD